MDNNLSTWWLRQKQLNITCGNLWPMASLLVLWFWKVNQAYFDFIGTETGLINSLFDDSDYVSWILHVVIDDQWPVH